MIFTIVSLITSYYLGWGLFIRTGTVKSDWIQMISGLPTTCLNYLCGRLWEGGNMSLYNLQTLSYKTDQFYSGLGCYHRFVSLSRTLRGCGYQQVAGAPIWRRAEKVWWHGQSVGRLELEPHRGTSIMSNATLLVSS